MTESYAENQVSLSRRTIFVRYVSFAIVAGLANILAQEIVTRATPTANVIFSVLAGTAVGFFVKYVLDKRWIFNDVYSGRVAEIQKIGVYGISSVGTTLLFWGIELGAWHLFGTMQAKYLGAVLGLSAGNAIKYALDKRYVFSRDRAWRY